MAGFLECNACRVRADFLHIPMTIRRKKKRFWNFQSKGGRLCQYHGYALVAFGLVAGNAMETLERLLELDTRHNDLLDQLAELDARITETLKAWGGADAPRDHEVPQNTSKSTQRKKSA